MQNLKGEMKVNNLNDFFFQIKKKREMVYGSNIEKREYPISSRSEG